MILYHHEERVDAVGEVVKVLCSKAYSHNLLGEIWSKNGARLVSPNPVATTHMCVLIVSCLPLPAASSIQTLERL